MISPQAREKYEADCVHINSYTAQSTLLQGKELDKITLKLERAQQTVQANERDYMNFARALSDTARRWEGEWKTYCDVRYPFYSLRSHLTAPLRLHSNVKIWRMKGLNF